jgi:SAM-dependent methyltransferase
MPGYDKELLARLNEEYRDKPYLPVSEIPTYDPEGQRRQTEMQYTTFLRDRGVEVEGRRILEVGCGYGVLAAFLAERAQSVVGLDLEPRPEWEALQARHANLRLLAQDISRQNPFAENEFDLIVSFVAFEHMEHPYAMLQACHRVLEPGGRFLLHANLYPSAVASHSYRVIHFPYVQLLFSEEVIAEYLSEIGRPEQYQRVNCLTLAHYQRYFDLVGFKVDDLSLIQRPLDEAFIARFAERLERWPRFDLALDYFAAYLRKPGHPADLASAVWPLARAEEAARWRVSADRGHAQAKPTAEGLAVRVKAQPGPVALEVRRALGLRFVGRTRLGIECRASGWGANCELLMGIAVGEEFQHAAYPIEPDRPTLAQAPPREAAAGGLPETAELRFVLRGDLARKDNEWIIKQVWM